MKSIFTFLTVGALACCLVGCGGAHDHSHGGHGHDDHDEPHEDEIVLSAAAIEHHGIALGQAEQRELRETFSAPARVAFNEDALAHVGTLVSGRVSRLAKGVGDPVAAGDVLFVIDSAELGAAQNDHLAKRAQLAAATTGFQIAEQYFQSGKELSAAEAVSRAEVQQREVALHAAEAKLKSARAALAGVRNRLRLFGMTPPDIARLEETGAIRPQAEVRSPISGTVVERGVTLGETVNPEQSHLFVVAGLGELWLLAEVPPARAAALKAGQSVTLTDPATGRSGLAKLDSVSPVASPGARTVRARAVVENGDGEWRPGMFVTAKLPVGAAAVRSVAVPAKAVQDIGGQPVVFVPVPGEANTFTVREVAVGPEVDGWLPVKRGLVDGEALVVRGGFLLKAELGKAMAGHDHSH
ncbi:MAG: efflux RND transporter periplasmic adaptor subunit [Verrucomicrobia bacterium]|nr:efflux RND transporter periplasmic adaptor subunit [Verrucomicrobiota bacterium]